MPVKTLDDGETVFIDAVGNIVRVGDYITYTQSYKLPCYGEVESIAPKPNVLLRVWPTNAPFEDWRTFKNWRGEIGVKPRRKSITANDWRDDKGVFKLIKENNGPNCL